MGWDAEQAEAQYWESQGGYDERLEERLCRNTFCAGRKPHLAHEGFVDIRPGRAVMGTATHDVWPGDLVNIQLEQETTVATASIEDRKAALRRQQEEIALRIEKLSRIPSENPFSEGEIGRLVKVFPTGEAGHTYAFVYVAGKFYTTGTRQDTRVFYSWNQFANWIGEGTWKIERATEWEDVSA